MTSFDQHENAFETEFAHREELAFKVRERAIRLPALWAAKRLGKPGRAGQAYVQDLVAIDIASPTPDVALGRIVADLSAKGVAEKDVRRMMDQFLAQAHASLRRRVS